MSYLKVVNQLLILTIQAFLDFCSFNFRNFRFNAVYNSILFSSPLVLLSNLDLHGFCFPRFFMCLHINSVNQGMPALEKNEVGVQAFLDLRCYVGTQIKNRGSKNRVNGGYLVVLKGRKIG